MITEYAEVVALTQALTSRRDPYNHHQVRTGLLAELMADAMSLSGHEKKMFVVAANIHDLGKLLISAEILNAPRNLSKAEQAVVKQHTVLGYGVALELGYDPIIRDVILHHHENYNGTGYPDRLARAQITEFARAMRIIDVWDAMNSKRAYRSANDEPEVVRLMLKEKESSFDPRLLDLFFTRVYKHVR